MTQSSTPRKAKPVPTITLTADIWYRCPECDSIIPDQGRRCDDCNKFGSKLLVWLECPHCDEPITEDELS